MDLVCIHDASGKKLDAFHGDGLGADCAVKKNILFIVLPYFIQDKGIKDQNAWSVLIYPYGVLSIASYLNANVKREIDIQILDLNLHSQEEMSEQVGRYLEKFKPDVVGISMMFDYSYKHLRPVSKQIKDRNDKTIVILGGVSATVSWKTILQEQPHVDAICYSDGEYTMKSFMESGDLVEALSNNSALVTRRSLAENKDPVPKYVENLNEVINVDYELINTRVYGMREAFSPFSSIKKSGDVRQFCLVTSRGCPYLCVFCAVHTFSGMGMRYVDVDVLIGHIRHLVEKYGMNVLTIYDDQLLLNRPRAKELFRRLAEFKIRVEVPNGLTVEFIDEEMAFLMKRAGIDTVSLAIESGSARMINAIIRKPLRLKRVKPVTEILQRNNIFVLAFFIVGLPGEEEADREETLQFIKDAGIDWCVFSLATPLRGSELYEICKKNKYIDPSFGIGDLGYNDYVIKIPGIDPEYIKRKRYLMNLDVNFVNNRRMRVGDYKIAAVSFEDVVKRYPGHAFGHYYLSKALQALGENQKAKEAMNKYKKIVEVDSAWKEYAGHFNLN